MIPAAFALSRRYREIDVPVTLIAGNQDHMVDYERQSKRLAGEIAGAKLVTVPGGSHMVHYGAGQDRSGGHGDVLVGTGAGRGAVQRRGGRPRNLWGNPRIGVLDDLAPDVWNRVAANGVGHAIDDRQDLLTAAAIVASGDRHPAHATPSTARNEPAS